jgi:hypothetical protein
MLDHLYRLYAAGGHDNAIMNVNGKVFRKKWPWSILSMAALA